MRWLSLSLAVVFGTASFAACSPVVRNFESAKGGGGNGQGGGSGGGPTGSGGSAAECNKDADCAAKSTSCAPQSCVGKFCRVDFSAVRSSCTEDGGHLCDGKGHCVVCVDATDCPLSPTLCQSPTCSADGTCGTKDANDGTMCMDGGGKVCSNGGCVVCNTTPDCSPNNVCQNHTCVGECTDGLPDGNETGIDCGGGSCPPCPAGEPCNVDNDCVSTAACENGMCAQCGANYHQACGHCNGVFDCVGNCTIPDPANYGQPCGQCGGTVECDGQTCSVNTPSNLGDPCTTNIHCTCGYNLPGNIDCAGKCAPNDSCSCCGQFPC
jgi:hypothetical protein